MLGSEYVNASWVCGRRRVREWCVAQHPAPPGADLWRLLWDHTAQLVLALSDTRDPVTAAPLPHPYLTPITPLLHHHYATTVGVIFKKKIMNTCYLRRTK